MTSAHLPPPTSISRLFFLDYRDDDDIIEVDNDWWQQAVDDPRRCRCGSLRPAFYPEPVHIELAQGRPTGVIGPAPMAAIVHKDLLTLLRPHLPEVITGRCKFRSAPVNDFVTVYSRVTDSLFLRGPYGCRYSQCSVCNSLQLNHEPIENKIEYITTDQLRGRHAYMLGSNGSFMITEALKESIDWSLFPSIDFCEYPVLETALDGRNLTQGVPQDGFDPNSFPFEPL